MVIERFPKLRFLVFFRLGPFLYQLSLRTGMMSFSMQLKLNLPIISLFGGKFWYWLLWDLLASKINVIRYSPGWSRSRSPPSTWRRSPGSFARSGSVSVEPRAASSVRPSTTRLSSLIRWSRLVDLVLFVQAANVKRITIRISMLNCQNLLLPIKPKIQYSLL